MSTATKVATQQPVGIVDSILSALGMIQDENKAPRTPWFAAFLGVGLALALFGAYRWYQQHFSFTVGLDYFESDFDLYWMRLFWIQITVIAAIMVIGAPLVWFTRPADPFAMTPRRELLIYYIILSFAALGSVVLTAVLGIFVEADAAWHQVTVRDTDFTPTHIGLFYFAIPLAAVAVVLGLIWIHTRVPLFAGRVSVPLLIMAGAPVLIMPNLGFNEWGHTFFYMEELFAAPIHWGFVTLGWGLFAIGGVIIQILTRIRELTKIEPLA